MITGSANAIGSWYRISVDALVNSYVSRVEADGGITESADCLKDRITTLRTLGLWDKASAVWLPHGYKEGKLYAAKGGANADLSISRAGTRGRKGPTYVERVPYNRASYSENFENAAWSKDANVSVTASAGTPPTGRTKADRVTLAAGTSFKRLRQASATPGENTFSIHFKYETHRYIQLFVAGDVSFYVNLDIRDGIASHTGNGSTTITDAGNGWFEVVFKFTTTGTTLDISAIDDMSDPRGTLDNVATGTYLICGAQMVVGHTARSYFRTTDRFNVPALDYSSDSSCPSLSLEPARTNLLLQSETFDNASWTNQNTNISANQIAAPDGLSTADKITDDAVAARHSRYQSVELTSGTSYVMSVYAKSAGEGRYLYFAGFGLGAANEMPIFNLDNGTVDLPPTTTVCKSATIESVLDEEGVATGWYRCIAIITAGLSGPSNIEIGITNTATDNSLAAQSYTGAGLGFYIWGVQAEQGSYATSYIPTTTATVSRIADTVSALHFEKTNLALHSEDLSNAVWIKGESTITSNAIVAPDGNTTADKLTETINNGLHRAYQSISTTTGKNYTYSVYAKAAERTRIFLQETTDSGMAIFNLSTLAITGAASSKASIESVGDGWYRCSLYWTALDTSAVCQFGLIHTDGTATYVGDGTSGAYFWGAQFEVGTKATTYLPTTTATKHDGSVIGQTEGTFYFEASSFADSTYKGALFIGDGTINNRLGISFSNGNKIEFGSVIGGLTTGNGAFISTTSNIVTGQTYKACVVYSPNYAALFVDGVKIGEDLIFSAPPNLSVVAMCTVPGPGTNPFYGNGMAWVISPTKISDAEAISWTTP